MKNVRIRIKLLLSFITIGVLCCVIGGVGIYGLNTLSNNETRLYEIGVISTYEAGQILANIHEQRTIYRDALIDMDDEIRCQDALKKLTDKEAEFDKQVKALEGFLTSDAGKAAYADLISKYYGDFKNVKAEIVAAAVASDNDLIIPMLEKGAVSAGAVVTDLNNIVSAIMTQNDTMQKEDTSLANGIMLLSIILLAVAILSALCLALYNAASIAKPIARLAAAVRIAKGDVNVSVTADSRDEVGQLASSFRAMIEAIKDQSVVMEGLASGDYRQDIDMRGDADVMNRAIGDMIDSMNKAFGEITTAAAQVSAGAQQIAQGAQNLAEGSTEQAASVQELSASISDVHEQTLANAKNAELALVHTEAAGSLMMTCISDMSEMTSAMQAIAEDSAAIGNIIKVIDDIASKTNLLSLNASVEAARVGQHGKGFAVVADEVRALAAKSTEAAKNTAELIEGSAHRVSEGTGIVARTEESLKAVASEAEQNLTIIKQIAKASQDQAAAISEINVGIDQISTVVQGNSATAEESAAAAQEMSSQSAMLNEIVVRFKLKGESPALDAPRGHASGSVRRLPRSSESANFGKY